MDSKLEIKSIWEDKDGLFEVRVKASNRWFAGAADCYTNRSKIADLSEVIEGFPKTIDHEVRFTTGERDDISFFSLFFKCEDRHGSAIVRVKIAHIMVSTNANDENYISEFDIPVEAAAIDIFARQLNALSTANIGGVTAVLRGKT